MLYYSRNKNINYLLPDLHHHIYGRTIQELQDKGLKSIKRNCLKKWKENEPVRERDRTAKG